MPTCRNKRVLYSIVQGKSLFVSSEFSVAVIRDVVVLLTGRRSAPLQHILAALSDMHAIFRAARKQLGKGRYSWSRVREGAF